MPLTLSYLDLLQISQEGKSSPKLTVFSRILQDTRQVHYSTPPPLFSVTSSNKKKPQNKILATLIVWNRKYDLCVIDHWHHNIFLSLFFCLVFLFCYTYKADICGWFSPSPTMYRHPEKQHWTTTTFTHLCPTLPKRSKAKKSNQRRTM